MQTITVNSVEIQRAAILAEVQHHPASNADSALDAAAHALVVRELLLQRARAQGIEAVPELDAAGRQETAEDALIRALLEAEVATPRADENACRRYYANNRHKFRSPDIHEVAHILLAADPTDPGAYERAVREAETLIPMIERDPTTFAALARERSACPSAQRGGNLGQITKGQTVPEFESALARLDAGMLSPAPVQTRYGAHIVRVDRKVDGEQLPLEAVADRIAEYLEAASWQRAVAQYLRILASQATITGIEIERANGPLVQ